MNPTRSRVELEGFGTWQTSRISLIPVIVHAFVHNAVLVISFLEVKGEDIGTALLLTQCPLAYGCFIKWFHLCVAVSYSVDYHVVFTYYT